MGIASLWRELAWDVKYNNKKTCRLSFVCACFFLFSSFFCPHRLPVWTKYKSHRWYCSKGGAAGGLCLLQAKETRLFEYNSWKSGLCISQNCRVGESTFGGVTVGYCAFKTHIHAQKYSIFLNKLYIRSMFWLHRLSLILTVLLLLFFPRYKKTLPKTTSAKRQSGLKLQGEQEKEQKWAGERWCARGGWESLLLKKSWDVT